MSTLEQLAREKIDSLLESAGWVIQDVKDLNLGAGLGVAVREFQTQSGPADYVMFVDRKAVGVIEAKKEGTTLSGVSEQTAKYVTSFPDNIPHVELPLPFCYESTGTETQFADTRDPEYRSRKVFAFHKPETLREWLTPPQPSPERRGSRPDTLRGRLQHLPPLITEGLWDAQVEAIHGLENKPIARTDFFYEPKTIVFVDGSHHYKDYIKVGDDSKRRKLRELGFRVVVVRGDDVEGCIAELGKVIM